MGLEKISLNIFKDIVFKTGCQIRSLGKTVYHTFVIKPDQALEFPVSFTVISETVSWTTQTKAR